MKTVAWVIGTVMIISGGYQLGQIMESPSKTVEPTFTYEDASIEAQENWLSEQSALMERRVQRTLGTNSPTLSHLSYKETKIITRSKEIQFIAKMSKFANGSFPHDFPKTLKDRICPSFIKSALYEKKVSLTIRVERDSGGSAFSTTIRPSHCYRYTQVATN